MGKNIHSSRTKINKSHLRQNVFGPVEQARAERLSAKLLEVARQPKPERTEMETIQTASDEKPVEDANEEQMKDAEIDGEGESCVFATDLETVLAYGVLE